MQIGVFRRPIVVKRTETFSVTYLGRLKHLKVKEGSINGPKLIEDTASRADDSMLFSRAQLTNPVSQ